MNKQIRLLSLAILGISISSVIHADYQVKYKMDANIVFNGEIWKETTPKALTNWINKGVISSCSNWAPSETTVLEGTTFEQTATDCKQEQVRTVQKQEINNKNELRDVGQPYEESQYLTSTSKRNKVGTKVITCSFVYSQGYTQWQPGGGYVSIRWQGAQVGYIRSPYTELGGNINAKYYTYNGFIYVKGNPQGEYGNYSICRVSA